MNRLTKLFLSIMIPTTILALTYPAIAERAKHNSVKEGFSLEISMDGRQPFTLSVSARNQRVALLPVKEAKASAVKVITSVEGGSLKFKLLAVLDELPEIPTCDNIRELKTEPVASYVVGEGGVIRVSDFERFGVAPFIVKVTSPQAVCPEGACCCDNMTCFPNPGFCIQCGPCGLCCAGQ